jgi:hypothetical protein
VASTQGMKLAQLVQLVQLVQLSQLVQLLKSSGESLVPVCTADSVLRGIDASPLLRSASASSSLSCSTFFDALCSMVTA